MPNIKVPASFYESQPLPTKPRDEFDAAIGVGGKHLAPKRPLDYVVSFLTLTVISALVAGGGVLGLRAWDASLVFDVSFLEEEPAVPQLAIAIVDGTNSSLGTDIRDELLELGWNVVSTVSLSELDPNLSTSPSTLIFLSSEEFRDEASGLLARFPGVPIEVSGQFADPITVLLGSDFAG
jgi:hypothetical protein